MKLEQVQKLMAAGDDARAGVYETIGVFFGYDIATYADFYDFRNLLVLGRVMTGEGGDLILSVAGRVLREEFPEVAERIRFHIPGEQEKRHGQAIAAASLPAFATRRNLMQFHKSNADLFVPDGAAPEAALARTTHLSITAHQDDIEIRRRLHPRRRGQPLHPANRPAGARGPHIPDRLARRPAAAPPQRPTLALARPAPRRPAVIPGSCPHPIKDSGARHARNAGRGRGQWPGAAAGRLGRWAARVSTLRAAQAAGRGWAPSTRPFQ